MSNNLYPNDYFGILVTLKGFRNGSEVQGRSTCSKKREDKASFQVERYQNDPFQLFIKYQYRMILEAERYSELERKLIGFLFSKEKILKRYRNESRKQRRRVFQYQEFDLRIWWRTKSLKKHESLLNQDGRSIQNSFKKREGLENRRLSKWKISESLIRKSRKRIVDCWKNLELPSITNWQDHRNLLSKKKREKFLPTYSEIYW